MAVATAQPAAADGLFGKTKTPDYYEANAREHFRHFRWAEGKKMLDEGWEMYGSLSVMNELMGRYYYHYKMYDKARFYLVRALRDDDTNTQAREILVNVEEETHNYSSAICYINELLERNPYSRGWWRRKINIYRKLGNNTEANRLLTRLQQIYPNDEVVKKDVVYLNEQRLIKQKRDGDNNGMLESLQNLIKAYPNNPDYYMNLSNLLLQTGRNAEAAEITGRGARITKSLQLMKKHAAILTEQGKYTEAINYLRDCIRTYGATSLNSTINEIELSAAEAAQLNDPYTSMAKVYAKQRNSDALHYLLNTAISRGYYDDALMYINYAKQDRGVTNDLLYKEYIVQRRLGNKSAAFGLLERLYKRDPNNEEIREYLAEMHYEAGVEMMNMEQYGDAISELLFVQDNAVEADVRRSAMLRLFNCYRETKLYPQAHEQLEKIKTTLDYADYDLQKAALYYVEGKTEAALNVLEAAYNSETDPNRALLISSQYGEYAIPYVKNMIERGMLSAADKAIKEALLICPTNIDLLHMALTTSDLLGNTTDYREMVAAGRERYPDDPFFITKEAGLVDAQGDHEGALAMLRPQLDVFQGDSTIARAFAEFSLNAATEQSKAKAYNKAIATLDTALVFNRGDRELLYNKGLIYEKMKLYDSAYVYQKYYRPTLMDFQDHKKHLEELQGRNFPNQVTVEYQQARPGDEDIISANAYVTYARRERYDEYTASVAYAGRDGSTDTSLTDDEQESGGTGIQLGFDWTHHMKNDKWKRWSYTIGGAWSSKYFPRFQVRGNITREFDNDWTANIHASYRNIKVYAQRYAWVYNTEKESSSDPDFILTKDGWNDHYKGLWQLGVGAEKTWTNIIMIGSADALMLNAKLYFNVSAKGQFFPIDGSRTHVYATAGLGNAPQTELLDNSMPAGFEKLNTFVGGGLMWFFNKHIAGTLSGTWYTMYRSSEIYSGIWGSESAALTSSNSSNYKNMFYVNAQVIVMF